MSLVLRAVTLVGAILYDTGSYCTVYIVSTPPSVSALFYHELRILDQQIAPRRLGFRHDPHEPVGRASNHTELCLVLCNLLI